MAEHSGEQNKGESTTTGFYVFMGLVLVTLVIIVGYVIRSYFAA